MTFNLPGDTSERYEDLHLLGAGGMGAVYRAFDKKLQRPVALKVIRPELLHKKRARKRFRREVLTLARLDHPCIVRLFEFHEHWDVDVAFFSMEYIEGRTLGELIEEGSLDVRQTVDLFVQLADALAAAHEAGVLHRDLKPENIMVTRRGFPKIMDFGLARLDDPNLSKTLAKLTVAGHYVGTMGYIAPEVLSGKKATSSSDVYQLGVVLYEVLTSRRPYSTVQIREAMYGGKAVQAHPPSRYNESVDHCLDSIVEDSITVEPEVRIQTSALFKERCENWLAGRERVTDSMTEVIVETAPAPSQPDSSEQSVPRPWHARGLLRVFGGLLLVAVVIVALAVREGAQGSPEEQFLLGDRYRQGDGVERDEAEAFSWYLRSANQGYVPAMWRLSNAYRLGKGVEADQEEAARWIQRIAELQVASDAEP